MSTEHPQFMALPSPGVEQADILLLPLPLEKTVSYGTGTSGGPSAILEATQQVETFDEETFVDFADAPKVYCLPPVQMNGMIENCLEAISQQMRQLSGKFVVSLGGEHSVTYGTVLGLVDDPSQVTVVQLDAHADLADRLHGDYWSHGTVMRRLWERGCRLLQIGIRSLTKDEYQVASTDERISTYYAHQLDAEWPDLLQSLRDLKGKVYLTIDVDGLDPAIIPSTGTPQPGGLSWKQTMEILRVLTNEAPCELIGADIVEFVPSPVLPGCDPAAARLLSKLLAYWWIGRQ